MPDAVTIPDSNTSANFTALGNLAIVCESFNSVNIQLTGSWVGNVNFEASPDGFTWYLVQAINPVNGVGQNMSTVNGTWVVNCGGFHQVRANVTSYTSGTVAIYLNASFGQAMPNIYVQGTVQAKAANGGSAVLNSNGMLNYVLCGGCAAAIFQISGTWVGTFTFQGTAQDAGSTFVPLFAVRLDTNPTFGRDLQTTTTTNGTFKVDCAGMSQVRCVFTAYTSGSATVTAYAGVGQGFTVPTINRGRNVKGIGMASGFRVVGSGASPQNILSLENGASSSVLVGVRSFSFYLDSTAAQTAVFQMKLSKPSTQPSAGTTLSRVRTDSTSVLDNNVVVRCGASADGTNSSITATADTTLIQVIASRPHTMAGWFAQAVVDMIPDELQSLDVLVLRPGEFLLLQATTAVGANNVNTISYVAGVVWEEFVYG